MDLFVARQPIFDAQGELTGYELLYRGSAEAAGADPADPLRMSSDVIVQNFLEAGLSRLTDGLRGFVNFTREMILTKTYELFNPEAVVIELVEDIVADREMIAACREMTSRGYTLALDDFVIGGVQEPLLPDAHIVKMDLLGKSSVEIRRMAQHLKPFFVEMLAERVETAEVAWAAEKNGFTLFQGYYFSRPETIGHKTNSVEALRLFPLLNLVQSEWTPDREIERVFRSDPDLSYKLIQIANSTTNGELGVESIQHALRLVGRDMLYRWLTVLLASSLATSAVRAPELLKSTLVRARFLEAMGGRAREDAGSLFLVGLFSNMDALLGVTMPELLERVKCSEDVQGALLGRDSRYSAWLGLAEAYEVGDWDRVAELATEVCIDPSKIPDLYMPSLEWASSTMETVMQQAAEAKLRAEQESVA